jgi:fumarate hydratase class II
MNHRTEKDTLGEVQVPAEAWWGAQTERSRKNFTIGIQNHKMPLEVVHALAVIKKAAALVNADLGVLSKEKAEVIAEVCDEIVVGTFDDQFPLVVFQTGSGTQTNMNVNEVIANVAHVKLGGALTDAVKKIHPNDDVNKSQSSNDVFPTAMHVAAYTKIVDCTLPKVRLLREELSHKSEGFAPIIKIGRTHLMDATPMTLGQEFSGYVCLLDDGVKRLLNSLKRLTELALGGTAVGTGLNSPEKFDVLVAEKISFLTGFPFVTAPNKFAALSGHDALVEVSSSLKQLAVSLMKIGNDIRLLGSGPRTGIGELLLPENEPGSSIMPGKVNPTQCEALTMVCAEVFGCDTTVTVAAMSGQLELNVFKPVIIYNVLEAATLLGEACESFAKNCVVGLQANERVIAHHLEKSLMLVTALAPHIGYEKAAMIAKTAHKEGKSLREVALENGVFEEQFDEWVDPKKMI